MLKVPEEWDTLLAELHNREITAVIAGGAVRDYYCGRQPKDIDIFMNNPSWETLPHFAGITNDEWNALGGLDYIEHDPQNLMCCYEIKREVGLPINLIACGSWTNTNDLISGFDFGLCQAAYDGKQFHTTPAFLKDWKFGEFTMMHGKRWEKSTERYQRISQRYSGWPMKLSGRAWLDKVLKKLEEAGKFVDNDQEIPF